jgi:ornithine cyclodeaminase
MLVLDSAETRNALPLPQLIDALRSMFKGGGHAPPRHHHDMEVPGEVAATLLLMPAWVSGRYFGVKMVSVFPGNGARGLPAIYGSYLLSSGLTGELLAVMDGGELTARRTAAASALASSYLSRPDASTMLMVGTGRLSLNLIEAHAVMRSLSRVLIWGRDRAKAEAIAREAVGFGLSVETVTDLESAARQADIISCATLSEEPLIRGDWLAPGAHLDLVGAFKPSMRESDDRAVSRASLFVDTYEGALAEAGDILQPLKAGVIDRTALKADLADLCAGRHSGRASADEITLFKSVGASIEDLAGAILALEQVQRKAAEEL